jgi:hypothetical protein
LGRGKYKSPSKCHEELTDAPTKGRNRKAPSSAVAEDDDEEPAHLPLTKRSRKIKIETEDTKYGEAMSPGPNTLEAELFKVEEDSEDGVDLERDEEVILFPFFTMLKSQKRTYTASNGLAYQGRP